MAEENVASVDQQQVPRVLEFAQEGSDVLIFVIGAFTEVHGLRVPRWGQRLTVTTWISIGSSLSVKLLGRYASSRTAQRANPIEPPPGGSFVAPAGA